MRPLRPLVLLAVSVAAFAPRAASADEGAWVWIEVRQPLVAAGGAWPRTTLRLFTDVRGNRASHGLHQTFLRVGPLVDVAPWMFVGAHATIQAERQARGAFDQEARAELEPNLRWRIGSFAFNDRNRFEVRWRDSGTRYRYRNQLRVQLQAEGARWIPFLWDEMLVDLSGLGFQQNRATVGLGRMLSDTTRLEAGYLLRSAEASGRWTNDHILVVYLFVDAPR